MDTDPDDDSKDALNSTIMDLATSLAQLEQSELHVVHAWTMFEEDYALHRDVVPAEQLSNALREVQEKHQKKLDQLLGEYELKELQHEIHLRKGAAAAVIPRLAHDKQIDLIVMGTVCRTGIAGFFIGNTAEKILQDVDCAVLTVKPEGFVSPVAVSAHRQQTDGGPMPGLDC